MDGQGWGLIGHLHDLKNRPEGWAFDFGHRNATCYTGQTLYSFLWSRWGFDHETMRPCPGSGAFDFENSHCPISPCPGGGLILIGTLHHTKQCMSMQSQMHVVLSSVRLLAHMHAGRQRASLHAKPVSLCANKRWIQCG